MHRRTRAKLQLIRWLQPGKSDSLRPEGVRKRSIRIQSDDPGGSNNPFEAWVYSPRQGDPLGAYLIAPGLHFLGPRDPRLDRFLTVLASAGLVVLCPFLPSHISLRVRPTGPVDFKACFRAIRGLPEIPADMKPAVFTVSFGSILGLSLAADGTARDHLNGLIIFGGFANWLDAVRFSITGRDGGRVVSAQDPLNRPAVFLNYIDHLPRAPDDRDALDSAWRRYVMATWGRERFKHGGRWKAEVRRFGASLTDGDRAVFEVGCGLRPGGLELFEAAAARADWDMSFLDPLPLAPHIRCPVTLFHGADDDVIPASHMARLAEALSPHTSVRAHLTGLYGHTGTQGLLAGLRQGPAMAREVATMLCMVQALIDVPTSLS